MATAKTRINVSVNKQTRDALNALAKRDQQPVATTAVRLIEEALELDEGMFLSKIADERLSKKNIRWVKDNDAVWK